MKIYDAEYDFEFYGGEAEKIICVYFVPRSGSNFLADKMRETGKLGYPLEYFSADNIKRLRGRFPDFSRKDPSPIFNYRTSPNGVFSFKWNSNHGPISTLSFKPDYAIFLDRRDRTAQAKSYLWAQKTGQWLESREDKGDFSYKEIKRAISALNEVRQNTFTNTLGLPGRYVFLEDLMENTEDIISDIIFDVLGDETEPQEDTEKLKKTVVMEEITKPGDQVRKYRSL